MIGAERHFDSREELAAALAGDVTEALRACLASSGIATLAVSGGNTPTLFFDKLSDADLSWDKVTVTLVDERMVPETSPRSNARLVRGHLLKGRAAAARFVALDRPVAKSLRLDAVVLGMGSDGHTASFFPGGDTLAEALDPATSERIVELKAPGAGETRMTFTLPALLAAKYLFLHIEGGEKQRTLMKALVDGPVAAMPIRAVLRSERLVAIYWCP